MRSPVYQVQVQADGAAAVPLAALVSALHPLDQPGRRRRWRRQLCTSYTSPPTSWSISTSSVAGGGGESPRGARSYRHHLLLGWEGGARSLGGSAVVWQGGSEWAVPRLPSPLAGEDAVDVERLPPWPPRRPVPP